MKTALAGIPALPDGMICELYTITLRSGLELYFTTADLDLTYRGDAYLHGKFNLERGEAKSSVGANVDDVTLTVYANDNDAIAGVPLMQFVNNGGFDGAWIKIERARQSYVVHLFEGLVTDAQADRVKADLTISSGTVLLNTQMPRNVYSPGCINTLFDGTCGLAKTSFDVASTALSGSTTNHLICGLSAATDYYDLGTVTFTSGQNNGVSRTIKNYTVGNIYLAYGLPHTPDVGDTFKAYPGCDKRLVTCNDKFGNKPRFRGMPFMPSPEASV
jgi:uncharacterized phage protein (TIGR02218 family)